MSAFAPFPVIVGAPRSGTTLLRLMLDSHPLLAIPPETGFIPHCARLTGEGGALRDAFAELVTRFPPASPAWAEFGLDRDDFVAALPVSDFTVADGLRTFYRLYAGRFDKPRSGDKTPLYAKDLPIIGSVLPEAHFIHIIRDGRDVALSWRDLWFAPGRDMTTMANAWRTWVEQARADSAQVGAYVEVRYEELVTDPERVLRGVAAFLDLPFDGAMLEYHTRSAQRLEEHLARYRLDGTLLMSRDERLRLQPNVTRPPDRARIGAWRSVMSSQEIADFQAEAGDLLNRLGYA